MPTKRDAEDNGEELPDVVDAEAIPADFEATEVTAPVPVEPSAPSKRSVGPKEAPPFTWKLVGESSGLVVTLFKATDRAEVEGQLERVRKDGYYTNLQVVPIEPTPGAAKQVKVGKSPAEAAPPPAAAVVETPAPVESAAPAAAQPPRKPAPRKAAAATETRERKAAKPRKATAVVVAAAPSQRRDRPKAGKATAPARKRPPAKPKKAASPKKAKKGK
ncbi:MAG TPA: hypothetical protein PKK06_03085 [Phycisphaerae bacterium]|nr:hypothetical protein [Phycisphaerae bacterium]HNU44669.1 hypothetical protein [Phycisphaerae bacterium]